jgi:predicted homoserine dehydrogenase-like protein
MGGLPLGLAHDVKVVRAVPKGRSLTWADVAIDTTTQAVRIRRAMEDLFVPSPAAGPSS